MDCVEGMKQLDDNSIDLIITSPPYNLGKTHHTGNNRFKSYDVYQDDMPEQDYQRWQCNVLAECHRVLKKEGSMWYNHKNRIRDGVQISPYEWLNKTPFLIKQEIVWQNGGQNFDSIRFYPMTERVYWLAKSSSTKMDNKIGHHDIFTRDEWKPVKTDGGHKRAYPQKMCEDIMTCFPAAKIILDPFLGSGTTRIAAYLLNRDFVGFEIDKGYFDAQEARYLSHTSQLDIFQSEVAT